MKIHTSNLGPNFEKVVQDAIRTNQPVADTGVAIAVIKDGQLAFAAGSGFRNRATSSLVEADTCFAIGSATKAFTSMAVSMLAAQGQLTLDQPIKQLLPDFALKDPQATQQATLTDILCHRTGLAPHNCLWYLGPFTRSGLYYRLRYLDFAAPFRSTYVYNNLMYMLAGYLLETISGASYEEIIKTRILDPLGMGSTNLSFAELVRTVDHAKGYENGAELALKDFSNIGPAAEINSTVLDMAKWTQLFLHKGVGSNGGVLIGQPALEQMYAPIIDAGDGTMYGLGWNISSIKDTSSGAPQDKRLVFHTGDPVGGSAYVSFMPDDGLGVVLLTNQHCTQKLIGNWPDKVARDVYDYLLNGAATGQVQLSKRSIGHGLGMAAASAAAAAAPPPGAAAAPAPLADPGSYAGMYANDGYGEFTISRSGSNLSISYYGSSWPLVPVSDTVFGFLVPAFGTIFPIQVFFTKDNTATVTGFSAPLVLQPHPLPVSFVKR
jgi:CubicO group peptidase (beta-lactamase class C family)